MGNECLRDRKVDVSDQLRAVVLHLQRLAQGQEELLGSSFLEVLRHYIRSNRDEAGLANSVLSLQHGVEVAIPDPLC